MTDYEKRIAVAEAWPIMNCHLCGYPNCSPAKAQFCSATHYDPINDLNAIHGAWLSLNDYQKREFHVQLGLVVEKQTPNWDDLQLLDQRGLIANATSPQRCAAFLRTHQKWEELK